MARAVRTLPGASRTGDAFGRMLLRCLNSDDQVTEVVERGDGYVGTGDARRYFAPPEDWSGTTRWAVERARGRVLDVGAGAGQHTLVLQARGEDVTALDISAGAIEVLRRRGASKTFHGSVHQLGRAGAQFDCAMFMGNNLGLFANPKETERLARSLDRLIAPGGRVLGTGLDAYDTTDPEHLAVHAQNRERGRLGGQMRLRVRFRELRSPWFDYLMISPGEFGQLLEGTPWRIGEVHRERPNYALELLRR